MACDNRWRPALDSLSSSAPVDPHLGHALEFLNLADGGAVLSTISAHVRNIPAGFETRPRRSTDGTVFVVVEGEGILLLEGREITLAPRDIVVVPSWIKHQFQARTPLVLFAYSDRASQEKLDLYREQLL